jgi:hypothetical protein
VKFTRLCILAAGLSAATLKAATVTVTITGTTGEIRVGEGPIFGHKSYSVIPPGEPFVLTYTFDEDKGMQSVGQVSEGLITQSQIENTELSSPGVSATLQIGNATWEFGSSKRSQILLKTAANGKSEQFVYVTQAGGNRISAQIVPSKGGYWPKSGDWRSTFTSGPLDGSSASFWADNDRVSARGTLVPATIEVSGVDIDGQWLRSTKTANERSWQLAHASPHGGYVVEQVTLSMDGTRADGSPITPSSVRYWQAWKIAAGATAPMDAAGGFAGTFPSGAGEAKISAVARFYEGLVLPSSFAARNSPYAAGALSSMIDPKFSTHDATLPVETSTQAQFGSAEPLSPR